MNNKNLNNSIDKMEKQNAKEIKSAKMLATKQRNRELKLLKKDIKANVVGSKAKKQELIKQSNAYFKEQKKIQSDKLKAKSIKVFHLNAKCVVRTIYYKNGEMLSQKELDLLTEIYNKHGPEYKYVPQDIKDIIRGIYYEDIEYSNIFYEPNYTIALHLLTDLVHSEYYVNNEYMNVSVVKIKSISQLELSNIKVQKLENTKMKANTPLQYDFICEDKSKLTYNDCCVIDNFLGTYKHVKKEEFIKLANEIEPCNMDSKAFTPLQLHHICKAKDISHYAVDVTRKCFLKYVSTRSHHKGYQALVYFCVNEHMYHVTNKDAVKSLIESAKSEKTSFSSICFDEYESKNIFNEELPIFEDLKIINVMEKIVSCIVMYNKSNLNDEVLQLLDIGKVPLITKCSKTNIQKIIIKKSDDIEFHLIADSNDLSQDVDEKQLNFKLMQELCIQFDVEFKNQSFTSFVRELNNLHQLDKSDRKRFGKTERELIRKKFNGKCNGIECDTILVKGNWQIDHIIPLAAGGSNDMDNLQPLCKPCHTDKTSDEVMNDGHFCYSQTHSSFNDQTEKIFNSPLAQAYAFNEIIAKNETIENKLKVIEDRMLLRYEPWMKSVGWQCNFKEYISNFDEEKNVYKKLLATKDEEKDDEHNIDINGCRKNLLYYNKHNLPQFTVMDTIQLYKGQTQPGYYYVETESYLPLHGNGLYFYPMIKYCLEQNIINQSNIKWCIISSLSTPCDHFNSFIDFCNDKLTKEQCKLAINSFIGSLAAKQNNVYWTNKCIVEKFQEAYEHFVNHNGAFINVLQSENSKPFYQVFTESKSINIESEKVIYNFIVELEAIELHKTKLILESKGAKILEYKTDAIRYSVDSFPFEMIDEKNIDGYFWDAKCTKPKYKIENKEPMKMEMKPRYIRTDTIPYKKHKFNIHEDVEDNNFEPLVKLILDDLKSVFLTGIPGSGKTSLIEDIKKELDIRQSSYCVLTPTNISAILVDGMTLDKFSKKLRSQEILNSSVKDYVIVDEVSMMKEQFYKMLSVIKKFKPETKFILSGDFEQFSPVLDRIGERSTNYYKNSEVFHDLCNSNILKLTKCRRADKKHFDLVSNYRQVKISDYNNEFKDFHISYTNKKRIEVNTTMMLKHKKRILDASKKETTITLEEHEFSKLSQKVFLFENCPIIAIRNKKELNCVNGERFNITAIDLEEQLIYARDLNYTKDIVIPIAKFQTTFHVAFCITAHKSQGQTIKQPYTIHDFDAMPDKCKYVALSRASQWGYCNLLN